MVLHLLFRATVPFLVLGEVLFGALGPLVLSLVVVGLLPFLEINSYLSKKKKKKQSPRSWFAKFSEAIEKFGMQKRKSDHSVFYRNSQAGIILLVVYVDDIIITGNDIVGIYSLKSFLHGQFHT